MADPYQALNVPRDADDATIKKAYRKLAKEYHPDRNADKPGAAERFSAITAAYDLLTDKEKRARYDRGEIDENGNPKAPMVFPTSMVPDPLPAVAAFVPVPMVAGRHLNSAGTKPISRAYLAICSAARRPPGAVSADHIALGELMSPIA
jgi:curved DNA-binding protein CbpA